MNGKQIASIEMSAFNRTDEEICEKQIATLLKLYKMDRPLPKHIKEDIDRVLENIGWCCWFADWINHRIYCWCIEIAATSSRHPDLVEFVYWEDIQDSDSESEDEEECVYVIKTWEYNRQTKTIKYNGLWEKYDGDKEFKTEQEARDEFDNLTQNGYGVAKAMLIKIDPNSNEDRETIIEEFDWEVMVEEYLADLEDDKCKSCGWRSEYPESHILYCGGSGCEYIRDKYKTWINEDGEMIAELLADLEENK